jgi:hypothetical protein
MVEKALPQLEPAVLKHLMELAFDIVETLIDDLGSEILEQPHVTVNGANKVVVSVGLLPSHFDAQLRAAVRARGYKVP